MTLGATTVCGITVKDLGILGMIMLVDIMGRFGVSTVSLVMETAEPNCGSFIGVVTSSEGDVTTGDDTVCDVTVAVFSGIGAMVMFFKPTFLSILAALLEICPSSGISFFSCSFSDGMFWTTVPPFPSMVEVCISVTTVVSSVFLVLSPSWSC